MAFQPSLSLPVDIDADAYQYGLRADGETHGVVLTKPHIVDLILDLAGYLPTDDLGAEVLLEPSCGHGAFLTVAVSRLLASAAIHGRSARGLESAVVAFDIDAEHVEHTRRAVAEVLRDSGIDGATAHHLARTWVRHADFLLADVPPCDFIVGNPPYIRIEQFSPVLQAEYRRRFQTIYDRADLYVAFIERGLDLLSQRGVLAFICADRWTLNQYGKRLREFITARFHVRTYVDLHSASPFEADVIAYPSIFSIGRQRAGSTSVVALATGNAEECAQLARRLNGEGDLTSLTEYSEWFKGDAPWILSSPEHLSLLRSLERRFPALEEDGMAAVRIGVATGCDAVYVVPASAEIEPDRLVPLVMRDDISAGQIKDAGRCVINTSDGDGLIDLERYPRLRRYLEQNELLVRKRRVSRDNQVGWFKTIDKVHADLVTKPKLLIPDIAGANEVALDAGRYYPHHNLYFVLSDTWDLEVLGALLSSRVALFFVWSYAVKMRGGYLRFQAQYLRRIRVPRPDAISDDLRDQLRSAFRSRDFPRTDELARQAYGLSELPDFQFVDTRR